MIPIRRIERINDETIRVVPESGPYFEADVVSRHPQSTLANASYLDGRTVAIMVCEAASLVHLGCGPEMVYFESPPGFLAVAANGSHVRVVGGEDGRSTRWESESIHSCGFCEFLRNNPLPDPPRHFSMTSCCHPLPDEVPEDLWRARFAALAELWRREVR